MLLALTALTLPVRAQDIPLARIAPYTVLPSNDAKEVSQGIRAALDQVNAAGGIRGRKLTLDEYDDQYNPDVFVQQWARALEKKPVALLAPIGSASMTRMLKDGLLDSSDVTLLDVIPGAEPFRTPGHARMFHVRAGDRQQIEGVVQHLQAIGVQQMTVLYQTLPLGAAGFKVAMAEAARDAKLTVDGVEAGDQPAELAKGAEAVKARSPQTVLVIGAPRYMADGVAALRKVGLKQPLYVMSYAMPALLVKVAGEEAARGVAIAQTFPNPNSRATPLQRNFQTAMKHSFPDVKAYTSFHVEGYITVATLVEALKRSREDRITPSSVAKALHDAGEIDLQGFRIDFSHGNNGSSFVDLGVMNSAGELMYN